MLVYHSFLTVPSVVLRLNLCTKFLKCISVHPADRMRKLKGSCDLPCPFVWHTWLGLTVFQAYSFVHYKGRSGDAKFTKWVGFCLHVAILAWILAVALSLSVTIRFLSKEMDRSS